MTEMTCASPFMAKIIGLTLAWWCSTADMFPGNHAKAALGGNNENNMILLWVNMFKGLRA